MQMDINLEGKTALIGGGSQGIGKYSAIGLAKLGARVILVARNAARLASVKDEIDRINSRENAVVVADFNDPDQLKATLENRIAKDKKVHILVNNTGGPAAGAISSAALAEFKSAFEMHLMCNHIMAQAVIPFMKTEGYGRIINIISTSVKQPLPNLGVSNTVRGAVANWAKTMANELGQYNITVNNVLPGPTNTSRLSAIAERKAQSTGKSIEQVIDDMGNATPMNRVGEPEEVANAVCFLASPAASYINGINLPVDGGRTTCL